MPHHLLPQELDSAQQLVASEALATLASMNYFQYLASKISSEIYAAVEGTELTDEQIAQRIRAGQAIKQNLMQMQAEALQFGDQHDSVQGTSI